MADNRCFVQFPHPGDEHSAQSGRVWNTINRDHKRKFMQFRGEWTDEGNDRHSCDLRAWGEWEPESKLVCKLGPKNGGRLHPNYLWKPYWIPRNTYRCLHNTDPFIFGDCFLYSNCGQSAQSKKGLKQLGPGSVIAFGSGKKIEGQRRWVLDTVLVIKDSFPYGPLNPRETLEGKVPDGFLEVTGGPLVAWARDLREGSTSAACAPKSERFRLYRGATPYGPIDEMFSFFPAVPVDGESTFARPVVSLDDKYFISSNWQAPKGAGQDHCPDVIRDLWRSLCTQVREKGLVLGTRAEMPERVAGQASSTFEVKRTSDARGFRLDS